MSTGIAVPREIIEPEDALRRRFARGEYIERSLRGEFVCCLKRRGQRKTTGNLVGMRTYAVGYLHTETGVPTFTVHFFMDEAGNVGASGLLDPKWLYEDGIIYTCNRRVGAVELG